MFHQAQGGIKWLLWPLWLSRQRSQELSGAASFQRVGSRSLSSDGSFLLERPCGKGKVKSASELSLQCYWDTARAMEQSCCAQWHPSWGWHVSMRILYLLSFLCLHQQCLSILPFHVSLVIQFVLLTVVHNALEFIKHACELLWSQGKVYLQNIICHLLNVFWRCTLICNRNGAESILK